MASAWRCRGSTTPAAECPVFLEHRHKHPRCESVKKDRKGRRDHTELHSYLPLQLRGKVTFQLDVKRGETSLSERQKYVQLESKALKHMYRIAREIKTFNRRIFLQAIVEEAFDVNSQGATSAVYSKKDENSWVQEAKTISEMGPHVELINKSDLKSCLVKMMCAS